MEKYNVICLLLIIRSISVYQRIYTLDSYWCIVVFFNSPRHVVWDTSMNLDAAMWNGSCIVIFRTLLELIYPLTFYCFVLNICLCFLCIVICMHSIHSVHICIVCNSVICTNSFNIVIL